MSISLSEADHKKYDQLIFNILRDSKEGLITSNNAAGYLGHILAAAAMDNISEVENCLTKERYDTWLKKCSESSPTKKEWGKVLPI